MRAVKIVAIVLVVYALIVVAFESLLGYFQPSGESTMVITATAPDGTPNDRVLQRVESGGQLYASVNHWPRAWYHRALENPRVEVAFDGRKNAYHAVLVDAEEYARVRGEHPHGLVFRLLTGFPPRAILRLDPRADG